MIPISVLILTHNEEINIARCIRALPWCDDIVVLDSGSTDKTVEIASRLGARVETRPFDNFSAQRNFALDHIPFDYAWVLHLDADEVVTEELRNEMAQVIHKGDKAAYRIASRLMMNGRWLRRSGMYPSYQVRLGRKDRLRFEQVGHGQRECLPPDEVGTLESDYLHYGFSKGLADWLERHNRYSSDEARQTVADRRSWGSAFSGVFSSDSRSERRRNLKRLSASMPFRPTLRFIYMYVFRLGLLDGRAGFTYCRMMAMYEYWIVLKVRELKAARNG